MASRQTDKNRIDFVKRVTTADLKFAVKALPDRILAHLSHANLKRMKLMKKLLVTAVIALSFVMPGTTVVAEEKYSDEEIARAKAVLTGKSRLKFIPNSYDHPDVPESCINEDIENCCFAALEGDIHATLFMAIEAEENYYGFSKITKACVRVLGLQP